MFRYNCFNSLNGAINIEEHGTAVGGWFSFNSLNGAINILPHEAKVLLEKVSIP